MQAWGKTLAFICAAIAWNAAPARAAGDTALGEYLSSACVTCHQKSGQVNAGIPSITGWPIDQFTAVMNAYKNKDRDNEVMRTLASTLSDQDIAALAAYFGSLKTVK